MHWEDGVLATGPPGKSLIAFIFMTGNKFMWFPNFKVFNKRGGGSVSSLHLPSVGCEWLLFLVWTHRCSPKSPYESLGWGGTLMSLISRMRKLRLSHLPGSVSRDAWSPGLKSLLFTAEVFLSGPDIPLLPVSYESFQFLCI